MSSSTPASPEACGKRLGIIVPYRDRMEHLAQFVPHMLAYFSRDEQNRNIPYSIHIVEQAGTHRFNRGKLKNCGFALTRDQADYFCFHDVDYLPVRADYSYCERPARLIWHGLAMQEDYEIFFGAVVLFPKKDFIETNGFSNEYAGWGFEDSDLLLRMRLSGLDFEKRDGTYIALPHKHAGYNPDGTPSVEALDNLKRFDARVSRFSELRDRDGLSSLQYTLESTTNYVLNGDSLDHVFHHKVAI